MRSLSALIIILALTGCVDDTRQPTYPQNREPTVKLLRGDYDTKNISLVCIDGIKYIVTEQGGIAPKYQSWQDVDATVEECE